MASKIKPTLIGGIAIGILSIIPFVSALNLACCAWAILGGGLAAYIYVKDSTTPVAMGEGAMVGGLAGALGAFIYLILYMPMVLLLGLGATYEQMFRNAGLKDLDGNVILIGGGLFLALMLAVMATVGGVIGTKLFEKRSNQMGTPPVPPPDFGNMPR